MSASNKAPKKVSDLETVTDQDFEKKVLKNENFVLVLYFSGKFKKCIEIINYLCELAEKFKERIAIFKINIDKNRAALAREALPRIVPSILFFYKGRRINMAHNFSKREIEQLICEVIGIEERRK